MDNSEKDITVDEFLKKIGIGRRNLDDPFFDESHRKCKVFQRTGITVEDDEELCHKVMREFRCNVYGCNMIFHNLIDYEIHYNGSHRYVCQECKKIRPNARLLEIHIQETHDSFFKALADKQPMYQCYVSECDSKFSDPNERRSHCVNFHKFPKNFRYDVPVRKKEKAESTDAMEIDQTEAVKSQTKRTRVNLNKNQKSKTFHPTTAKLDSEIKSTENERPEQSCSNEKIVPTVKSALCFIPRQVAQKSYTKALTKNKKMERNVLETETMMDLAKSLPE